MPCFYFCFAASELEHDEWQDGRRFHSGSHLREQTQERDQKPHQPELVSGPGQERGQGEAHRR